MSIVVTTPTGNIGGALVRHLLDAGEAVTVLARDPARLDPAVRERVTVSRGDQTDAAFVGAATAGAEALFWLTPPSMSAPDTRALYAAYARSARAAVEQGGVRRVVNLSSAGAHNATGYGPISLLQKVENALNETGADVTHLRPGYFFENYLAAAQTIAQAGTIFLPLPGDAVLPMVATRDIAAAAAESLRDRSWGGIRYRGLHGPRDLSVGEAAAEIGAALGRPVAHARITPEQARDVFLSFGASPDFADRYVEMFSGLSRGAVAAEPRTPETTTPTTLRAWAAEVLGPVVEAASTTGPGKE